MVDFVGTLQAVTAGVKALKELNDVEKEYDKAAEKLKLAELSTALATAQVALAEAQSEIAAKDKEIQQLQENFKIKDATLMEHRGLFFRKGDDGKPRGRPHCPKCLDAGKISMTTRSAKDGRIYVCAICKAEVAGTDYGFDEPNG